MSSEDGRGFHLHGHESQLPSAVIDLAYDACRRERVPGLVVGVHSRGVQAHRAIGVSDVRTREPMTTSHRFRLCSLTKPFTASLAMRLVQAGQLDLDAPVLSVVGDVRESLGNGTSDLLAEVSMRDLLTHVGGFEGELSGGLAELDGEPDPLAAAVARFGELRRWAEPGAVWGYCNTGYWLAGWVCASVAGRTFDAVLVDEVLDVVGARTASWERIPTTCAHPHLVAASGDVSACDLASYPRARRPSGGLVGTTGDVLALAAAFLGDGRLLSTQVASEMTEVHGRVAEGFGQAIGWRVRATTAGTTLEHDGSYDGYRARTVIVPEADLAVAVLANATSGDVVSDDVVEAILAAHGIVRDEQMVSVDSSDVSHHAGWYEYEGGRLHVSCTGDRFSIEDGSNRTELTPAGPGLFAGPGGRTVVFPEDGLIRIDERLGRRVASVL